MKSPQPNLKKLLKTHFGFDHFLPHQEKVIDHVMARKDCIVIMPTGGGKSLCYQLPAFAMEGTAIVISPLIALMKDQVDALKANGIGAAFFNSSQPQEVRQGILKRLKQNELKLLYVAPESLSQLDFILKELKISLFAVDEAHCISAWGNDFRPAYQQLDGFKRAFPDTPIIALTATADRATRKDIGVQLGIPQAKTFISSFDRPNLFLDVRPGQDRKKQILSFLRKHPNESGIIYCLSRKSTESLAGTLNKKGFKAEAYHAGIDSEERTKIQENFTSDRTPIVVATIAFGMGIDKSNVRWVIHYNMPKNIEGYYQQIGRSGRDGLPAHTILFHSYSDIRMLRKFTENSSNEEFQLAKLERMQQFAESFNCRRKMLLGYFGEHLEEDCKYCDNCKNPPQYFDGTLITQKICSAVARLKEQEAIGILVDVLRGAQNTQIYDKGYQTIKTYGAAKDISWKNLKDYVIQLINQGILEVWFHEKGHLKLTPLAKKVLFKKKKVKLANALQPEENAFSKKGNTSGVSHQRGLLFEKLRELRTKLAREAQMPPYIIFGDKALQDMERRLPQNKNEFADISGVGKSKLDKYADDFLTVIKLYVNENKASLGSHQFEYVEQYSGGQTLNRSRRKESKQDQLFHKLETLREKLAEEAEIPLENICSTSILNKLTTQKPRTTQELRELPIPAKKTELKVYAQRFLKVINRHLDQLENNLPSDVHSYNLYVNENLSLSEIAQKRGLSEGTVLNHFLKMNQKGHEFDFSPFISEADIQQIQAAKKSLKDPEEIRAYFDYFKEKVPYWKIKMGLQLGS